jgi:hypothetical protein
MNGSVNMESDVAALQEANDFQPAKKSDRGAPSFYKLGQG